MPDTELRRGSRWTSIRTLSELQMYALLVPNTPGNYVLYEIPATSTTAEPFYVGQSEKLRATLLEHISSSEPNECILNRPDHCGFSYRTAVTGTTQGILRYLFDLQQPRCNEVEPDGLPIEIPDLPPGWEARIFDDR